MIIKLRSKPPRAHRRRCSFARNSLHVYRRALVRRIGLSYSGRPAFILDNLARALLRARVA